MTDLIRSQFQLLYDGLRPILDQTKVQSQSNDRLKAAVEDCLERYRAMEAEITAAKQHDEEANET